MGDVERQFLVSGSLQFARGAAAKWRASTVAAEVPFAWPDAFEGGHLEGVIVEDALNQLRALPPAAGSLRVRATAPKLDLHGFLLEDGMRDGSRDLVAVLVSAARFGGSGTFHFLQVTAEQGVALTIAPGGCTLEPLSNEAIQAAGETPEMGKARALYAKATRPRIRERLPEAPNDEPLLSEVHAMMREHVRPAIAALSEDVVFELGLKQMMVQARPGKWVRTKELFLTPADARRFYTEFETNAAVESGFNILAQAAPDVARRIGLHALSHHDNSALAMVACGLLEGTTDPAELDALLDYGAPLDGPWPINFAADLVGALASSRVPDTDAALTRRMEQLVDRSGAIAGVARILRAQSMRGTLDRDRATALLAAFPQDLVFLKPLLWRPGDTA